MSGANIKQMVGPLVSPSHDSFGRIGVYAVVAIFSFGAVMGLAPVVAEEDPWTPTDVQRIAAGVKEPVAIAFGQDGFLYHASLTDRQVLRVDLESGAPDEAFAIELPEASHEPSTETGVFGLALHPEFHRNGILYVSYSRDDGDEWTNVLSRLTLTDASGAVEEEVMTTRPGGLFHNGGRILIVDGHIWWTTGDASNPFEVDAVTGGMPAQEDGDLRGKVLRLDMDGNPAAGNPWGDASYTKGHRNVYGIAWDPENGRMLVTENANSGPDYLNLLEAGANYGWPHCEGRCDPPEEDFTDPVWVADTNVAPTGVVWFRGAFFFGTFNQGDVYRAIDTSEPWDVALVHHYGGTETMPPRVLDVAVGPDAVSLWFSTWDEIWRIDFPDDPDHPPRAELAEGPYWWEGAPSGNGAAQDPGQGQDGSDGETGETPAAGVIVLLVALCALFLMARRQP